jgi:2,3-bisphosphoglycerate-independent phosphoglycerate mutase
MQASPFSQKKIISQATPSPLISPAKAGTNSSAFRCATLRPRNGREKTGELAREYDFSFFEYWASDYAGHKQDMPWAVKQLETFDGVLKGLLANWHMMTDLILLTSDHGNMEDLGTRKHTDAHVPLLLFGDKNLRTDFQRQITDLTSIAPAINSFLKI